MKLTYLSLFFSGLLTMGALTSCLSDGDEAIVLEDGNNTDIPSDKLADYNPTFYGGNTATMPNIQYNITNEDGMRVFRIDMTGIQDKKTYEWLRLYGTGERNQNTWIQVDDDPKGIKIYNTIDDYKDHTVGIDMVFLVDNSGSMADEANVIARDLMEWSQQLENRGLEINFACVGYDGAINGAIDFTTSSNLQNWLNEGNGTSRTRGFASNIGNYSDLNLEFYRTGGGDSNECGMAALRFAHDHFRFTRGNNRIYVNFTDEPNQPSYKTEDFSVAWLLNNWTSDMGTIHTVFSDGYESSQEYNYLMSEYTGGTVINTNSSFTGISLNSLPVTDAMENSYIIRFTNIEKYMDNNTHNVKITVMDGDVQTERNFPVIFRNSNNN